MSFETGQFAPLPGATGAKEQRKQLPGDHMGPRILSGDRLHFGRAIIPFLPVLCPERGGRGCFLIASRHPQLLEVLDRRLWPRLYAFAEVESAHSAAFLVDGWCAVHSWPRQRSMPPAALAEKQQSTPISRLTAYWSTWVAQ